MSKNIAIVSIVLALIIGFGGGYFYGQSGNQNRGGGNFNGQFGQGRNGGGRQGMVNNRNGGGFTGGQIISKDDKSITISLRNGGSQIVYYSPSTSILKSASGSVADLVTNEQVTVTGTSNADGSVAAQSIQIRPASARPRGQ